GWNDCAGRLSLACHERMCSNSNDQLRAAEANLGNWLEVKAAHRSLPTRHWLLTIRNLTRRASGLTLGYDCYSEADDNQTSACATIRNAPYILRIGTAFFRRQKDDKVCDQITAVCHNCSDISLCGCWRTRQISSPGSGVATNLSFHSTPP